MSRRLREGLFWPTNEPPPKEPLRVRLADSLVLGAMIVGFVMLIGWMQQRDARDQFELAQAIHAKSTVEQMIRIDSYSSSLAMCMNGGVLWDAINETAYFCSKPSEIKNP